MELRRERRQPTQGEPFPWVPLRPCALLPVAPVSLLLYSSPLLSRIRNYSYGFLGFCTEIDWERRPSPSCALWVFKFASISYFVCLLCAGILVSLSLFLARELWWFQWRWGLNLQAVVSSLGDLQAVGRSS